jgi:protein TIF31
MLLFGLKVLKHLTEQAVLLQKKINELYKGDKNIKFPPIQIQQPSLHTVLAMLNIINGIVFIQSQDEELEKIRDELIKYEKRAVEAAALNNKEREGQEEGEKVEEKINCQDDDLQ